MSLTAQKFAELMPSGEQLESDEPEMESSLHYAQLALLVSCLEWWWRDRDDFFIGANLTVYYSREQLRHRDFRGPDFFLVKHTSPHPRRSWVVWEEGGHYPDVIIELLSPSTKQVDRTTKKQLYQDHFRTPEYFWFDPDSLELAGFRLLNGVYRPILGDERDWRYSEQMDLYLGVHEGVLRYFTKQGNLVPTLEESIEAAKHKFEEEQRKVEEEHRIAMLEHRRAETLAARLRALGVDPEGQG